MSLINPTEEEQILEDQLHETWIALARDSSPVYPGAALAEEELIKELSCHPKMVYVIEAIEHYERCPMDNLDRIVDDPEHALYSQARKLLTKIKEFPDFEDYDH